MNPMHHTNNRFFFSKMIDTQDKPNKYIIIEISFDDLKNVDGIENSVARKIHDFFHS